MYSLLLLLSQSFFLFYSPDVQVMILILLLLSSFSHYQASCHLQFLHSFYLDLLFLSVYVFILLLMVRDLHSSLAVILLQIINTSFLHKLKSVPTQTSHDLTKPIKSFIKEIIELITQYILFCQVHFLLLSFIHQIQEPALPTFQPSTQEKEKVFLQIPGMVKLFYFFYSQEKEEFGCACGEPVMKNGSIIQFLLLTTSFPNCM